MSLREFFGTSSFFCLATPQAVVQLVTVLDVRFFYFYHRQPCSYWAVHAGLLTPLTFARRRLSPLAAFTSGAYFLHNGRR